MNKRKCIFTFFVLQILLQASMAQSGPDAKIDIDLNQNSERISPLIYGQFIEFLGRCINGGIMDENSPLSNEQGFRKDVMQSIQDLKIPLLRFPGGTYVKIYHWKDGIGSKANRPKRKNLIWGAVNDNHFGTAEFVSYCRQIGAEPFLVVNMSTASGEEAADWVEYCNGTGDSYWANLRRAHGYEKPFNVKYWGIGNEEYAEPDAGRDQRVGQYIEDSWQILKLMKLQDSSIKITLVGNSEEQQWNKEVLSAMHPVCDFLSVHYYASPQDTTFTSLLKSVDNFNVGLDSMRHLLKDVPEKVQGFPQWYRFSPRKNSLKLAIDEWGIWDSKSGKGTGTYNLEYPYNWGHALAVGKFLNMFQRNADIIGLATWAQTVNVLAPIMTTRLGSYRQTVYTPLQAYRTFTLANNLPIAVSAPELSGGLQSLDATASISADNNELVLTVLSFSQYKPTNLKISFTGIQAGWKMQLTYQVSYTAPSLSATNSIDKNVVSETKNSGLLKSDKGFTLSVPAASLNFYRFKISK